MKRDQHTFCSSIDIPSIVSSAPKSKFVGVAVEPAASSFAVTHGCNAMIVILPIPSQ
jgi:hypothetical protein